MEEIDITKDHAKKNDLEPMKITKKRLRKFEAGESMVVIDVALQDIEKDQKRSESRRIARPHARTPSCTTPSLTYAARLPVLLIQAFCDLSDTFYIKAKAALRLV